MTRSNRLSLSIAGTAAVALASLPLGIMPANAARVSQGTTANIGVAETSSNSSPQEFNLGVQGGAATGSLDSGEMERVSCEVVAFYWTALAPDIVNSEREEQGLI